ncbi:hypothetical protein ABIE13_004014 [Ottowia thiooxydans]|uniref:Uncharacterized protein n=2 Tax=Ottowia thiooxydans TaxID=219182 RepID=A0ABV2QCY4_9BURK
MHANLSTLMSKAIAKIYRARSDLHSLVVCERGVVDTVPVNEHIHANLYRSLEENHCAHGTAGRD